MCHLRCPTLGRTPVPSHFIRNIRPTGPRAHPPPLVSCASMSSNAGGGAGGEGCRWRPTLCCVSGSEVSPGPTTVLAVIRQSWAPWPAAPIPLSQPNRIALPPPPRLPSLATLAKRPSAPPGHPAVPLRAASRSPPPSGLLHAAPRPPPARPAGFRYPDEAQVVVGPLRDPRHHVGRRSVPIRRRRGRGHRPPRHVPGFPRASGALLGRTTGGAALLRRSARIQASRSVGGAARLPQPSPRLPHKPLRSGLTAAMGSLAACRRAPH